MVPVAEIGRATCQLSPASIFAMVVGQGAIVHHHRDVWEHTLEPRHQLVCYYPILWDETGTPTIPTPGG